MPALLTEQSIENRQSSIANPQWDRAIIALLSQPTIAEAARSCGLGESTLRRWLHQPDFAHAYSQARQQAFSVAISYLQHISEQAVLTIQSLMQDTQIAPSVRLSAARTVLQMSFKAAQQFTLQSRLDQLENAATALEEEQADHLHPHPQPTIDNRQSTTDNRNVTEGQREDNRPLNPSKLLSSSHPTALTPSLLPTQPANLRQAIAEPGDRVQAVSAVKDLLGNPPEAGGIPGWHKEAKTTVTPFVSADSPLSDSGRGPGRLGPQSAISGMYFAPGSCMLEAGILRA